MENTNIISDNKKIEMNIFNVHNALSNYGFYEYSSIFVETLAKDNTEAKEDLRAIFRQSENWNEELDAVVIPARYSADPDINEIGELVDKLLLGYVQNNDLFANYHKFKMYLAGNDDVESAAIEYINKLAPNAYKSGQKKSKTVKKILKHLNLFEGFENTFADLADAMNPRTIPEIVYISVNPAHFLTMSNPDGRSMNSCHSLDKDNSPYRAGCTGYARDEVSFIVFTAKEGKEEFLNCRKTNRQIFTWKNNLLMQSRLYTSQATRNYGGVSKAAFLGIKEMFRSVVQKTLSTCLDFPNLWKKQDYTDNSWDIELIPCEGFGGYPDWIYSDLGAIICHPEALEFSGYEIGELPICLDCGEVYEWNDDQDGIHCDDCANRFFCTCCEQYISGDSYTTSDGRVICEDCRNKYYTYCEDCGELIHIDDAVYIQDSEYYVCESCADRHYHYCERCGEYHAEPTVEVHDERGNIANMCEACAEYHAAYCESCDEYFVNDLITEYHGQYLCPDCREYREEREESEEA